MKKINVIIPAYKCLDTLPEALGSVLMQDMRGDVLVTIVNDGDEDKQGYETIATKFDGILDIEVIHKEKNCGCGQARQTGIDKSKCEYLCFLDGDDVFASPYSLSMLYSEATSKGADIVNSDFCEELDPKNRKQLYRKREGDSTWMHGKLYRTRFLQYNDIRFNEARANEDNAFNSIAFTLASRFGYVEMVTYIWRFNPKSVTRSVDWFATTAGDFIVNSSYAIEALIERKADESKIASRVIEYLVCHYAYHHILLSAGYPDSINESYIAIAKAWAKQVNLTKWLDDVSLAQIQTEVANNTVIAEARQINPVFYETLREFIKSITEG